MVCKVYKKEKLIGMVFNIQRYSIDDGPGIRTTVFLKGCPLRCIWCSNPEGQSPFPELAYRKMVCRRCEKCINACPQKAIELRDESLSIDRSRCDLCGKCVENCLYGALEIVGKEMSVEEVMREVCKDMDFYKNSQGGITLSGGEPLSQPAFVRELLFECQLRGIHTCLDTCGYAPWRVLKSVLPFCDLVYFDIKHTRSYVHRQVTGKGNELIMRNLERVVRHGVSVVVRVPVIPKINDDLQVFRELGETLKKMGSIKVHLLPYHKYGIGKYNMLGRKYPLGDVDKVDGERLEEAREVLKRAGLEVEIRS